VMLYQDADDKILEQDIYVDLSEAERVGSSDRVHIVAQVDRFRAGYQGGRGWSSTMPFYVTRDDDPQRVRSQQVADLGGVSMSGGHTLVDFATWAIETFPAEKHVLILSDHGTDWSGGWSDPAQGGRGDPSIPLSAQLSDELYLTETDAALEEIRTRTGLEQFELIGLDASLVGHLEVFSYGVLVQVFGFTGERRTGAPREIIPRAGDTFTVVEKWLALDERGEVMQVSRQEGGTLVFGDQVIAWVELDAAPGECVVGFIVGDLDGSTLEVYE
jgi:hypothetical protein